MKKKYSFPRSDDIESFWGKPWDRPRGGPNRQGDPTEELICLAMGRVISNWDGVEAALLVLGNALQKDVEKKQSIV